MHSNVSLKHTLIDVAGIRPTFNNANTLSDLSTNGAGDTVFKGFGL